MASRAASEIFWFPIAMLGVYTLPTKSQPKEVVPTHLRGKINDEEQDFARKYLVCGRAGHAVHGTAVCTEEAGRKH
jgi:hypothetical protein